MKILLVCLGNICRSPLAHGLLQHKVNERGLDWTIDSAGTGDYHLGQGPDPRSVAVAARHGIDISHQQARQLQPADFEDYDHILVMDASNYQLARAVAPTPALADKVELILNYVQPGRNPQVPDPYWDDDAFADVYALLDEATDAVIAALS